MSDARSSDPLDVLRGFSGPVDPAPDLASHLRTRIERALSLPRGVTVSDHDLPNTGDAVGPSPLAARTEVDPTGAGPTEAGPEGGARHGDLA